ncbi:UNVERIFIED_CONTAM: hypothetical protein Sindi_2027200 [Sesamum indicum]
MKFRTENGVGEIAYDQKEARKCYNLSLKGESGQKRMKTREDAEPRLHEAEHLKPSDEYKAVQLVEGEQGKTTRIGANMGEMETMLVEFLRKNVDMFAWSPSDFKGNNPEKRRSFGGDKNRIIEQKVAKLLKAGYVSEVQYTEWLSNVVLVPKALGKWRMYTDFTDLNKACPKDPYPLPRIDVMVDSTAGFEMFSMMDAYQGMFQELIGETMEVYVGDMLVKSRRSQDHLEHLGRAFDVMRSERGIEANPEKIQAIMNLRSPTTIKEVQKLTGKIASLNRFISRVAENENFDWTEECERALQDLKNYLVKAPLPANPKEGEVLFLYLAVLDNAVSSVLVLKDGEIDTFAGRHSTQIATVFQSHKVVLLKNHPLKHVMSRPEASGRLIKWTVELMQYDIDYQPRTAQKAQVLADFVMELTSDPREQNCKWMLHVDGSPNANNVGAGILVQGPKEVEIEVAARLSFPVTNNEAEYEALILGLELAYEAGARDLELFIDSQLVVLQIEGTAENDKADALSKFGAAMSGIKDRKVTALVRDRSVIAEKLEIQAVVEVDSWKDEIIQYLEKDALPEDLIKAKRERADYVMREIHERSCGNHSGAKSLAQKVMRQGYFWPTMVADTKELVKKC